MMNKEDLTVLCYDSSIAEAIEVILRHCRTGLAVIDLGGRVAGFLSEEDIIKGGWYRTTYVDLKTPRFRPITVRWQKGLRPSATSTYQR